MMRDVMQSAGLVGFAELGLILFTFAFGLAVARVIWGMSRAESEAASQLPLED